MFNFLYRQGSIFTRKNLNVHQIQDNQSKIVFSIYNLTCFLGQQKDKLIKEDKKLTRKYGLIYP